MRLLGFFMPKMPVSLVYMLQSVEYDPWGFVSWLKELPNLRRIMYRRTLHFTKKAKALVLFTYTIWSALLLVAVLLAVVDNYVFAAAIVLLSPLVCVIALFIAVLIARVFITGPREKKLIAASEKKFAVHPAIKIAVAGSYGKTTMKELLATVLAEGKQVAATPGNLNVPISHARWLNRLEGNEEVLIIEYGEGAPGDVARFAHTTHPNIGVITGLAPAHLDRYPSLHAAGDDIFSLADYLGDSNTYVNGDSVAAQDFIKSEQNVYTEKGIGDWNIQDVQVGYEGIKFVMQRGDDILELHSELLGRHQIGPLAAVASIALKVGLTRDQVEAGIAKTKPFEHRLQPRPLNGAWILDDTYNGNIDGIRAGLALLKELPANRKVYVTPGLVDQGVETGPVHREMGRLIAAANPDQVVLMQNSAASLIRAGLEEAGYQGGVLVEADPLQFYTNLEHFVAAGDLVLMQNDWTDNYR
ncbi:MAG: hypothetical protein JWL85_326 [Candidatus Saccharibacteria bacterium]|nr:hypothetical protein [Candidatus Saccharibacteria bacterium]